MTDPNTERRLAHRDARAAWCSEHKTGDLTAVFFPGEELRCPGTRMLSGGARVVCGSSLEGARAKGDSRVTVRVRTGRLVALPHPGTDHRCRHCGSALELFAVLEATG